MGEGSAVIQGGQGRPGFSDVTGRDLHCSYHSSTGGEGELTAGWRGESGARTGGKQLENLTKHLKVGKW